MKAEQPKHAKQQDTPNNEAAEQQDGPIYGPPTEKEHWQAIKQAANNKMAELRANYEAEAAKLIKPNPWPDFWEWMKKHHTEAYEAYYAITGRHNRERHRDEHIKPLFLNYVATDPQGAENNERWEQWRAAMQQLDDAHKSAMGPLEQSWLEADSKIEAIQQAERRKKKQADFERRLKLEQEAREEQLREEIGFELCRELNVDHPDFDGEAFEKFKEAPTQSDDGSVSFGFLLFGPTGSGKSRAMAARALELVKWSDVAWITGARYADHVSDLGNPNTSGHARAELRRLAEVEYLFFDDIGSVDFTPQRISRLFALLHARYEANLVTYFSTNYDRPGLLRLFAQKGSPGEREIAEGIVRRMIGTLAEPRANLIQFKRRATKAAKGRREKAVC